MRVPLIQDPTATMAHKEEPIARDLSARDCNFHRAPQTIERFLRVDLTEMGCDCCVAIGSECDCFLRMENTKCRSRCTNSRD